MNKLLGLELCLVAALAAGAAGAQGIKPPHPTDAAAAAPTASYDSAFTGYMPYRDQKLAPWRDVNDEVARVGGHVGILRSEAAAAKSAPAAQPNRSRQ